MSLEVYIPICGMRDKIESLVADCTMRVENYLQQGRSEYWRTSADVYIWGAYLVFVDRADILIGKSREYVGKSYTNDRKFWNH